MRLKFKIWVVRCKQNLRKLHKQAQKIALAVVIMEFLLVGGYALAASNGLFELFGTRTVIVEVAKANTIKQEAPKVAQDETLSIETIADTIYSNESSRGVNNYSKCKAIGKVNNIGYGIDGTGKYMCFKDHAEEMETLRLWITKHLKEGMTEKQLMCHYSGNNYNICK